MYQELIDLTAQCYNKQSDKSKKILDLYYTRNGFGFHSFADIASLFGSTRQNIENLIKNFRNNIINLLKGGTYKQITASENLILWYSKASQLLSTYKYISIESFFNIVDMNIDDTFQLSLTYDIFHLSKTNIEGYSIVLHKKTMSIKSIETIVKTLTNILNTEIFWINSFDLIIQANKSLSTKITIKDFEAISKTMNNIEFSQENNVRLKYELLSSMEKKALRILEEKTEPIHKSELFQDLVARGERKSQPKSLINVLSTNQYVKSVGKTGKWVLSKYNFDTRHQADIIEWAFFENNPNCNHMTANEIYSIVCTIRDDLSIGNINAYLSICKDRFVPIGQGKYILTAWNRKYQKEIKRYEKNRLNRSRFELVLRSALADSSGMTLKQLASVLKEEDICLSEGRLFKLFQNDYMQSYKYKNINYYRLKASSDDNRLAFLKAVKNVLLEIKNGVEGRNAFGAFYNHDEPKSEPHIQTEIYERMRGYLKAEGIDISKEPFTGQGPVDFKFSKGYQLRVFMELKLASNPNIIDGLKAQLPQYMGSEAVKFGIFTIIVLSDSDFDQTDVIEDGIKELESKYSMHIEFVTIDGRKDLPRKSPSKLKSGEEQIIPELL